MNAPCRFHAIRRTASAVVTAALLLTTTQPAAAQPGMVLSEQKINGAEGGFKGILDTEDRFGFSVAWLGDLDGDGLVELAVGAPYDDDGGESALDRGAVWVLFLNPDRTVRSHQKISDTAGGFTGILENHEQFGSSLASLGDLDGDGVGDLAVGARFGRDGGLSRGAVWVLFLNPDGTVKSHQKISDTEGGFDGVLDNEDRFGESVAFLGDLDGDGVGDLAVGAIGDDDGEREAGATWVLFLRADGTVKSHQKISATEGGFTGILGDRDEFGISVTSLGDLDGDGVGDLTVGAFGDDDGGLDTGAVWVLFLHQDGTVKTHQKISATEGGFTGVIRSTELFGRSVTSPGDLDGDGVADLVVGAFWSGDESGRPGAVWVLFLNSDGTTKSHQKISRMEGGFVGPLRSGDRFGTSVASQPDGLGGLVVGAHGDGYRGEKTGAVWVLLLDGAGGCVRDLLDCNENGVPDECDIQAGTSDDCNENRVPDECEMLDPLDGFALSFKRNSARVIVSGFDGFPTEEITVSQWLRTSDTAREAGIFSYAVAAEDDEFLILDARNLSLFINGIAVQTGVAVTDGDWHHIALTWASADGVGRLYVDGIERFSGVVSPGHVLRPDGTVVLADDQDSVGGGFRGSQALWGTIDELRVWNVVRSQEEIRADMRRRLNGDEPGLVSYWRFDEGEGATAEDIAGDNDGEVLRSVWLETFDEFCGCVRDPQWVCDGDTDGDGQVNPVDSGLVQAAFGSTDEAALCQYDVDCDGQINPVDSGIVQSLFGTCEAPRAVCP